LLCATYAVNHASNMVESKLARLAAS